MIQKVTRRDALKRLSRVCVGFALGACAACSRQPSPQATSVPLRLGHTATLLVDGSILVAGGTTTGPVLAAQRVFPGTGQWLAAGDLNVARADHTATLLPDGTVLATGGAGADLTGGATDTAERFDPRASRWAKDAKMATPRMRHRAVPLADGTILVIGGIAGWRVGDHPLAMVERYDPARRQWRAAAPLVVPREDCAALLLSDGRVLAIGGALDAAASAEVYDPGRDTWTVTAAPNHDHPRAQSATLLPDGRALVAGDTSVPEIYDPARDRWAAIDPAPFPVAAVLLATSRKTTVLAIGDRDVAHYDLQNAMWQAAPPLVVPRRGSRILPLPDGTIALVCGNSRSVGSALPPLEIYSP